MRNGQSRGENARLEAGDILLIDQFVIHGGYRVLPQQRLFRNQRADVPAAGAHVAVEQLEPCPGEGVFEVRGTFEEALRDRRVVRVHLQRQIRGKHHRGVLCHWTVRVRHVGHLGGILWRKL